MPHITSLGAVTALALIFMRTNDENALASLPLMETRPSSAFMTPEQLTVRIIARCLIQWDSVRPDLPWIAEQIPLWMMQYVF